MKVTISCKYFSPRGGAQTFLFNLAKCLLADGHSVRVLALEFEAETEGIEVSPIAIPPVPKTLRDLAYARASKKALAADDADVSFGEQKSWGADVVRPGGGVHPEYMKQTLRSYPSPIVRMLKSMTRPHSPKEMLNHYIERQLYNPPGPRCVIANSRMVRQHLLKHYPHLQGRIELIYNGADCQRFSPELKGIHRERVREELNIPRDALVGVFASYDWRRKGLTTLIKALATLKHNSTPVPVYAIIVGKGKRTRAELLARSLEVADRLRFVGVGAPDRYYGASDLLLLPSFFDPCANVTLEGLACGLPVITTVHNGAHELLTQGREGFAMKDPADADEMVKFIEQFFDPTRLCAASEAARQLALRHTMQDMYGQIRDVLVRVAESKKQPTP